MSDKKKRPKPEPHIKLMGKLLGIPEMRQKPQAKA